ncbi:MAG: right-handed parallel beta-helix repeat-containing protein [Spirochaetes bacterium]|nr:right-handed parallel beta-helix repeat-containing protein [Spirochaetota bacterium]
MNRTTHPAALRAALHFLAFAGLLAAAYAADYWVAPGGDDAGPGTKEKPFRSLERARDASRSRPSVPVTVYLKGGNWYLEKTLSFGPGDSGHEGAMRTWTSYPGERAVLVGGRRVQGWKTAGAGVFVAEVEKGRPFHQLFENGNAARKARHPNEGYLHVAEGIPQRDAKGEPLRHKLWGILMSPREFLYKEGDLPTGSLAGAEVYLWAGFDWFANILPISNVDPAKRLIGLERPALVPIVIRPERRYFIQNTLGALDAPGEFYLDAPAGRLYYRPMAAPIERQVIVAPTVVRIVEFRGTSPQEPVGHLRFTGIDFMGSDFTNDFVETSGTHGVGVWNEPMNKEAAIYFEHATQCVIERARIDGAGYSAVAFVWSARSNRVSDCEIARPGFHGVLLSGYRAHFGLQMDVNRDNLISNNWIHHVGRNVGHGACVFVWASGGNRIVNNAMHDSPRYGVCIKGEGMEEGKTAKWNGVKVGYLDRYPWVHSGSNLIADNDLFRMSLDTEDNGFISFWSCGAGNQVVRNLLHDSRRGLDGLGMAVYLDDAADDCLLKKNIVWGIECGDKRVAFFNKGQRNVTENNILVCGTNDVAAVRMWEGFGRTAVQHTYRRNLLVTPGATAPFIFEFAGWELPRLTNCDFNLFFNPDDRYVMKGYPAPGLDATLDDWRVKTPYDHSSLVADPLFVDPLKRDFRPAANSPAWKLGFEPIEVEAIGLRPGNPYRSEQKALQKALGCLPDYSGDPGRPVATSAYVHRPSKSATLGLQDYLGAGGLASIFGKGGVKLYAEQGTSIDLFDDKSRAGGRCLRFYDAPGPKYDPRLMVNTTETSGRLRLRFAVRLDPERPAPLTLDVRQLNELEGNAPYYSAALLTVSKEGAVMADKTPVAMIPPGAWAEFELATGLGNQRTDHFDLTLTAGGATLYAGALPKKDVAFRRLERLLIYGHDSVDGIFYVDGLMVAVEK